jgi:hypothetical protein
MVHPEKFGIFSTGDIGLERVELRFSLRFKNLDIFLADFIPG